MFQDFAARQFAFSQVEPPRRPAVEEAAELIDRYPNLSEIELARLINLYRDFSALDSALIISDRRLGSRLDRFCADTDRSSGLRFANMRRSCSMEC